MNRTINIVTLVTLILLAACSTGSPPCPPGAKDVVASEAEEALIRQARRKEKEGAAADVAVYFNCGYDKQPDGTYRSANQVRTLVADVLWCLDSAIPSGQAKSLTSCLLGLARYRFSTMLPDHSWAPREAAELTSKVNCYEFSRTVDLEADKHGLQREGATDFVSAIIFAVIQVAESLPVPSPALVPVFRLTPASGPEEACVDFPAQPARRCSGESGCPDGVPPGAESTDAGGVSLPPGTTPGDQSGASGDYP